jgi:hypothetical protein
MPNFNSYPEKSRLFILCRTKRQYHLKYKRNKKHSDFKRFALAEAITQLINVYDLGSDSE